MRWEDEVYVKLYTRDTPTWKAMTWQGRALLPLLLRKFDKAGLLECGELGRGVIGLMVDLPEEVVIPGLATLERFGVIKWHGNTLEMPNFEAAQEARTTDIVRKREQRKRDKDKAHAEALVIPQVVSHDVTRSHTTSRSDSPDSSAQTAQPSADVGKKPTPAPKEIRSVALALPPLTEDAMRFFVWTQDVAEVALPGRFPEMPPPDWNEFYPTAVAAVGSPERLAGAWLAWVKDPWAKSRVPSFAIRAFIARDKWREFVPPERKTA